MQIYVISIEEPDSPRLLNFFKQQFFNNLQQSYQVVGIKGVNLSVKEYFDKAVKGRDIALTPGELGCTLSHIEALKQFLKTDDSYALIFEDDAIIPEELTFNKLQHELNQISLPTNCLFSLGGIQMKPSRKVRGTFISQLFFGRKILEVIPDYYHRVNYAVAYIVDREMAKTLLSYHQPVRRADDWGYLFDFNDKSHILMTYLIDHPIIEKGETNQNISSIEAERSNVQRLKVSKYGSNLRKIFSKIFSHTYFYK